MIRKLRLKVTFLTTFVVAAVLLAVCVSVVVSTRLSIVQQSNNQLESALQTNIFSQQKLDQSSSQPCFIVEITSTGSIWVSGSSFFDLNDQTLISSIVEECLLMSENTGTLTNYSLRYYRAVTNIGSIRIAFLDNTVEKQMVRSMIIITSAIGSVSVLVLFVITWFLSGLITKPVDKAWQDQRRFLSDASHELKTPLTVILSSAELLDESVSSDDKRYIDNIRSESHRMKKLVDSMLTLSRADSGLQKTVHTPIDLSDLVTSSVLLFEPVAFENGKDLDSSIAEEISITGDHGHIEQLVGILLDNAIKYAPASTTIRLSLEKEGRFARLMVANEGEPIPPEKLPHLFERFYRTDESRSEVSGFGLGLSIAQTIAKEHHGSIRCESDTISTRFVVLIPLK